MIRQQRPNSLRDHNTTCKSVSSLYYVGLKEKADFRATNNITNLRLLKSLLLHQSPTDVINYILLSRLEQSSTKFFYNLSETLNSHIPTSLLTTFLPVLHHQTTPNCESSLQPGYITASFRKRPRPQPVRAAWHTPLTPVLSAAV